MQPHIRGAARNGDRRHEQNQRELARQPVPDAPQRIEHQDVRQAHGGLMELPPPERCRRCGGFDAHGRLRNRRRRRPVVRRHGLEVVRQGVGGPVAVARRLCQAGRDDLRKAVRTVRIGWSDRRRIRFEDAGDGRRIVGRLERPPPGHQLVQQHAERELIRTRVHRVAAQHFRRHVAGRAAHAPRPGQHGEAVAVLESREAEIDHLDAAVGGVHHVFRLQVTVDDPMCVRRRQSTRDVARYGQDFVDGDGAPPQRFAQRASGHVLADEVQVAVELLEREDRCDAGMRQGSGGHRLPPQTRAEPVVVNELRRQRLDRHRPIEAGVASEIDDAHPASPEEAGDLIRTELPPDE